VNKHQNVINRSDRILWEMGYDFSVNELYDSSGTHTQVCIVCFSNAVTYTGHVHKSKKKVIAGWCEQHDNCSSLPDSNKKCIGCYGEWLPKMGLTKHPFGIIEDEEEYDE